MVVSGYVRELRGVPRASRVGGPQLRICLGGGQKARCLSFSSFGVPACTADFGDVRVGRLYRAGEASDSRPLRFDVATE